MTSRSVGMSESGLLTSQLLLDPALFCLRHFLPYASKFLSG